MKTKKKTKRVIAEQFALPGVAGAPPPPAAVVERVGTLGELVARLPGVECALKLGEKTVVVAGRRLTPGEERRVFALVNECFPPVIPGVPGPDGKPGEERYAVTDPGYLKRKAEQYSLARALALWWGYPLFREQRAAAGVVGEPGDAQILAVVEGAGLPEAVLELLFTALTQPFVERGTSGEVAAVANFT